MGSMAPEVEASDRREMGWEYVYMYNGLLGRTRERNQAEKSYWEMQEVIGDRLGQVGNDFTTKTALFREVK